MEKPKWQLGRVRRDREISKYDEFEHMANQFVWLRAGKPTYNKMVNVYGGENSGQAYFTNLKAWGGKGDYVLLKADAMELLPYFLNDDPPTIPYEIWSRPDYRSDIHPENLPLERPE